MVLILPNAATLYDSFSTIKLFLLLLRNCDFATGMNCNINIRYAEYLLCDPCETVVPPPKGAETHRLGTVDLEGGKPISKALLCLLQCQGPRV